MRLDSFVHVHVVLVGHNAIKSFVANVARIRLQMVGCVLLQLVAPQPAVVAKPFAAVWTLDVRRVLPVKKVVQTKFQQKSPIRCGRYLLVQQVSPVAVLLERLETVELHSALVT